MAHLMDAVRQHFEQEATEFDRVIVGLIPHYAEMVQALVAAIPFDGNAQIHVVDLGCGTGTVAKQVLEVFPRAEVIKSDHLYSPREVSAVLSVSYDTAVLGFSLEN